jgi:hypothetical protein
MKKFLIIAFSLAALDDMLCIDIAEHKKVKELIGEGFHINSVCNPTITKIKSGNIATMSVCLSDEEDSVNVFDDMLKEFAPVLKEYMGIMGGMMGEMKEPMFPASMSIHNENIAPASPNAYRKVLNDTLLKDLKATAKGVNIEKYNSLKKEELIVALVAKYTELNFPEEVPGAKEASAPPEETPKEETPEAAAPKRKKSRKQQKREARKAKK